MPHTELDSNLSKITVISYSILLIVFLSCLSFSFAAQDDDALDSDTEYVGEIPKFEGTVLLREFKNKPHKLQELGQTINIGTAIRTQPESIAFVKFQDGTKVVLKENTQLTVKGINYLDVDDGVVLFDIAKVKRKKEYQVAVRLSILGIRGTQFLVDARNDEFQVYLKQGSMFIRAQEEEFQFIQKQFQKEFKQELEDFKKESKAIKKEFKSFKDDKEKSFKEFVKQIDLLENSGIAVSGNIAHRVAIPNNILIEFSLLERF